MIYRKLGKTNEDVSLLGFGCMRLPVIDNDSTKIDEEKAIKMIRRAIDEGVNYIDTAYPYHGTSMKTGGESEPFVAKALKDGYREKVKLATKLPCWLIKSREDFDKYLNEQLVRLETDHIDFYLAHSLNTGTWPMVKNAGITEFLDQAIRDGRIKYAGFSFHDKIGLFKEIVDAYDWSFCQIQYNYMDEEFQAGTEGLKYAAAKGLGVVVMEPLRGGKLVVNLPGEVEAIFKNSGYNRSPVEWALRWIWDRPEVSIALSGMTEMAHVLENIEIAKNAKANSITEDETAIINKVKAVFLERIKVNCTGCGYCLPCPAKVNIPGCFTYYNDHFIFGDPEKNNPGDSLYYSQVGPKQRASNCVECGKCEEHCPQGLQIRAELKKVKELFEKNLA